MELDLVMCGDEEREMSMVSPRFLFGRWKGRGAIVGDGGSGGYGGRGQLSMVAVPTEQVFQRAGHVKVQRNDVFPASLSLQIFRGTGLNTLTEPNLQGMHLWGRWQWGYL